METHPDHTDGAALYGHILPAKLPKPLNLCRFAGVSRVHVGVKLASLDKPWTGFGQLHMRTDAYWLIICSQ